MIFRNILDYKKHRPQRVASGAYKSLCCNFYSCNLVSWYTFPYLIIYQVTHAIDQYFGGSGGIRTPEGLSPLFVFKTNRFSRSRHASLIKLEETEGFEPSGDLRHHNLSRVAVSTTHTNLLSGMETIVGIEPTIQRLQLCPLPLGSYRLNVSIYRFIGRL